MQYILLIYENEKQWLGLSEADRGKLFEEYGVFTEGIVKSGRFRAGEALQPTSAATTIRVRNGKPMVTDGPFAETREQLGGFYLVEAKDLDEANALAARIPADGVTWLTSLSAVTGDALVMNEMKSRLLILAGVLALPAGSADAQNFLMNSAETINKGNFKLCGFPTVLLEENSAENEWGLASRLGYGFTRGFDVEVKLAKFDGLKMYGADAEWWVVRGRTDVSLSAGGHKSDFDGGGGSTAIDTAVLASRSVGHSLEAYVGGSLSFESLDDVPDSSFKRFYLAPGVEYKLGKDVDLLAEFGLGLNDNSPNYFSFGAAYYVR